MRYFLCFLVFLGGLKIANGDIQSQKNGKTFQVDNVSLAPQLLPTEGRENQLIKWFGKSRLVASHMYHSELVTIEEFQMPPYSAILGKNFKANQFVVALHLAHSQHRPLIISPDAIWMLIAQGYAMHVHAQAAKTESKIGRKTISVTRSEMSHTTLGYAHWEDIIKQLSLQVKKKTNRQLAELLIPQFSTTGPLESFAYHVNLLDVHKNNFRYQVFTLCGIPWIKLEGTTQDWENIVYRAKQLRKYGLDWWIDELLPILHEFIAASRGKTNKEFWQAIYKLQKYYENELISGWIIKFFPYVNQLHLMECAQKPCPKPKLVRNEFVSKTITYKTLQALPEYSNFGIEFEWLPSGISEAQFHYVDIPADKRLKLHVAAGFFGVAQTKDKALRPAFGWAIIR